MHATPDAEHESAKHDEAAAIRVATEINLVKTAIEQYAAEQKPHHPKIRLWLEVFGALVVMGATIAGIWNAIELGKQTGIVREQVHSGQRAYLLLDSLRLDSGLSPDSAGNFTAAPITVFCTFKNTGQTPARDIRMDAALVLAYQEMPEGYQLPSATENVGRGDLGTGQIGDILFKDLLVAAQDGSVHSVSTITPDLAAEIAAGRPRRMYVYARLRYLDVFLGPSDKEDETDFCEYYKVERIEKNGTIVGGFHMCSHSSTIR